MEIFSAAAAVAVIALASRAAFFSFPVDEDLASYAYYPAFAPQGIKLKTGFSLPMWRMDLLRVVHGGGKNGIVRIRIFLAHFHIAAALAIYFGTLAVTGAPFAAFAAGAMYAFFGSAPALTAPSFNFEQMYTPFILAGYACLLHPGPQPGWFGAAVFLGLAVWAKPPAGIFIIFAAVGILSSAGPKTAALFTLLAGGIGAANFLAEWALGYMDAQSRRQMLSRYAVAFRLSALKDRFGNRMRDFWQVAGETLPLWLVGLPAVAYNAFHGGGLFPPLFFACALITVAAQRAFSFYHYFPVAGLLAVESGIMLGRLGNAGHPLVYAAWGALAVSAAGAFRHVYPVFFRWRGPEVLSRYGKFDQLIYVPRVAEALARLIRMRKEKGRIQVWGNYVQFYHSTGLPAADSYVTFAVGPWDDPVLEEFVDSMIGGIIRHRPVYIVQAFHNLDIAVLEEITGLKYRLVKIALCRFPIYRFVSAQNPARDFMALPWNERAALFSRMGAGDPSPGIYAKALELMPLKKNIQECRKLVRLNGKDAQGLFFLGVLYDLAGMQREAADMFRRCLRLDPALPESRLWLAKREMSRGGHEEASRLVREEADLFGESRELLIYEGLLLSGRKEFSRAEEKLRRAMELSDKDAIAALYLADCLRESGCGGARDAYEAAFELALTTGERPIRAKAAANAAALDTRRPEHETLAGFAQRDPGNEAIEYAIASSMEKQGQKERALDLFTAVSKKTADANIRGAALYRMALLSPPPLRRGLLRKCLADVPWHDAAKRLLKESA